MNVKPRHSDLVNRTTGKPKRGSYATNMHPNPHYYKYSWLVFHAGSVEGRQFFDTPRLSTSAAFSLMAELIDRDEGYLVYNWRCPRKGDNVLFDFSNEKWRGTPSAPPYTDDTDSAWNGHK